MLRSLFSVLEKLEPTAEPLPFGSTEYCLFVQAGTSEIRRMKDSSSESWGTALLKVSTVETEDGSPGCIVGIVALLGDCEDATTLNIVAHDELPQNRLQQVSNTATRSIFVMRAHH